MMLSPQIIADILFYARWPKFDNLPKSRQVMAHKQGVLRNISSTIEDTKRVSCVSPQVVFEYLKNLYLSSNECVGSLDVVVDGEPLGVLFPHWNLYSLLGHGFVSPETWGERGPTRSLLVVTERVLNSLPIALAPADDWTETPLMDRELDQLREEMLLPASLNKRQVDALGGPAEIFQQWSHYVSTYAWKAELIWRWVADSFSSIFPCQRVSPCLSDPGKDGGRDGGIDDLRRTAFGLLATQVKGGSRLSGLSETPLLTANKFFIVGDPNRFKSAAREQRLRKWPQLAQPLLTDVGGQPSQIAERADDALVVHYLAFGKRWSGGKNQYVGKCGPWPDRAAAPIPRNLYVTGLDVVVLRSPKHRGKACVDASLCNSELVAHLERVSLIEKGVFDVAG